MRYGIIGSRDLNGVEYANYEFVKATLRAFDITSVVSGGGKGIERLIEQWARETDRPLDIVPPNIQKYGATEAFIHRNRRIFKDCDSLIVFWNGKPNAAINIVNESFAFMKKIHVVPME